MRITCPNCGAQYEVDDALIPEAGRDVQCSNCGKGWFQAKHPADEDEAAPETPSVASAPVDDTEDAPAAGLPEEPAEAAVPHRAVASENDDGAGVAASEPSEPPAHVAARDWVDEEDEEPAESPAMTPRKPDESVLAVLREEAEREIAQRRQEAGAIESQPDLGLAEPPARTPALPAADTAPAAAATAARRDLLPDIDMINSTLRSDADRGGVERGEADGGVEGERRRGFRMGFGLMILLAAALIGLYLGAGWLAAAVPALEPLLISYVEWANGLRAWIDGLLAAGVDGMAG